MAVSAVKKEAAKPGAEAEAPAPPPKKSFNWKLPVIALVVLGAAGGAAYWFMNRHHGEEAKEVKAEPAKPPVFLPLDPFTVNLVLEENPQYLQVGISLKVADAAAVDAVKLRMPEVRDRVLLLLSSQKASTLLTLDGKRKLAADIVASINTILVPASGKADAPKTAVPEKTAAAGKADDKGKAEDKGEAKGDDKAAEETAAKDEIEGDAKPTAEAGAAPAALPVQSVLFTSFIIQ
jgi:flagellar FliL protein